MIIPRIPISPGFEKSIVLWSLEPLAVTDLV